MRPCGRRTKHSLLERVEVRAPGRQAAGTYGALDGESFRTVAVNRKPVAEVLADESLGHLVKQQAPLANFALLNGGQGRHDEPVADIDVELVAGAPAGCMRVKPGPQALSRGRLAGLRDEVLPLGAPAAHTHIDEGVSPPHRVDASRAARHLLSGPVSESEQRSGRELVHGPDSNAMNPQHALPPGRRPLAG